jgi:general secretion pathway protein E
LQKEWGGKIGKILVEMGSIAQRDVLTAFSDQVAIPLVTVDASPAGAPKIDAHAGDGRYAGL